MKSYKVSVSKDYFTFCAGHFITYEGHKCEGLHGHNYKAAITVEGELDANWYVIDFGVVKKLMKRLIDKLDHKMLLPHDNPYIKINQDEKSIKATYKDRVYMFPVKDVVLLPIPNTTAEMLAEYLAGCFIDEIKTNGHVKLTAIEVEVEESPGQSALYRETF